MASQHPPPEARGERPVHRGAEATAATGEVLVQVAPHLVEAGGRLEHAGRHACGQVVEHVVATLVGVGQAHQALRRAARPATARMASRRWRRPRRAGPRPPPARRTRSGVIRRPAFSAFVNGSSAHRASSSAVRRCMGSLLASLRCSLIVSTPVVASSRLRARCAARRPASSRAPRRCRHRQGRSRNGARPRPAASAEARAPPPTAPGRRRRWTPGCGRCGAVGHRRVRHRPPAPAAVGVDGLAVGDRQHPRLQVRAVAQTRVGAERTQERLLEAVVRVVRPHRGHEEAMDVGRLDVEEPLERRQAHALFNAAGPPAVRLVTKVTLAGRV